MSSRGTCWEGYVQKGMKSKNGRMVPNCVPKGMKSGGLKKWFSEKWVDIGSSFEITELSAAVLQAQLLDYEKIINIKKNIYLRYLKNFKNLVESNKIKIQKIDDGVSINYHSFYIILNQDSQDFLDKLLNQYAIQAYIGYVPLHDSKYGKHLNLDSTLKVTEDIANKVVRLPIHTGLTEIDIDYICDSVSKLLN